MRLTIPTEQFELCGRSVFIAWPANRTAGLVPWVWYAPTLPEIPAIEEEWMFRQWLQAGLAVAGIDVGESHGSPAGRAGFSMLYDELVERRGFSPKPCMVARSRGGLQIYNWAVEHPHALACIVGVYPVCDPSSWPGLAAACAPYGLTIEQMGAQLFLHNPLDRLAPLARAGVPIFHIHGDCDELVPFNANTGELARRYRDLGGQVTLDVPAGQGHSMWAGFFQCQGLVDFVIKHAEPQASA